MAASDKVTSGVVVIAGVFVLAIVAGISGSVGKIALVFMAGILFIWLMTMGMPLISKWTGQMQQPSTRVLV